MIELQTDLQITLSGVTFYYGVRVGMMTSWELAIGYKDATGKLRDLIVPRDVADSSTPGAVIGPQHFEWVLTRFINAANPEIAKVTKLASGNTQLDALRAYLKAHIGANALGTQLEFKP